MSIEDTANSLDQLRQLTTVVADTGDLDAIKQYKPIDATTNPSLVLAAAKSENYQHLINTAVDKAKSQHGNEVAPNQVADQLCITLGCEILQTIPGRVSTEVDARLSFDVQASIRKAYELINAYNQAGVSSDRIRFKIDDSLSGLSRYEVKVNGVAQDPSNFILPDYIRN